ncbi:MAG: type IV pilus twitching motility protein PilT [Planctomycetota bacterium]|jgi:twitching motility protein PilT
MDTINQTSAENPVLAELLQKPETAEASDIHLTPGYPAALRIHGILETVGQAPLSIDAVRSIINDLLPERLRGRLGEAKNFDCSVALQAAGIPTRFRANVYLAQGEWCACLRRVPDDIPSFDWMGFPLALAQRLISYKNGLVIVTGVTGSGKSTTLAGLIDLLNRQGGYRVITVEEPIEYVHKPQSSTMITQREVGRDVDSFFDGLKYGLRQDPDAILVGEIRDRETASMALSAAETGHLIFATMHTQDAKGAVTRFTDLFPYDAQADIRTQLALSLRSVVNQHLVPSADPTQKRALAMEIMHVNQPVRTAIRQGKIDSLESAIQTGKRDGMVTLDEELSRLCMAQQISMDTARRFAKDPASIG